MKPNIVWVGTIPDNAPEYHDRIQDELFSLSSDDWENLLIHIVPLSHSFEGPVILISGLAADKVTAEYRDCVVTGNRKVFLPRFGDN